MGTTTYIVLKELSGNAPPRLDAVQTWLLPHVNFVADLWLALWILTALMVVWHGIKEYRVRIATDSQH